MHSRRPRPLTISLARLSSAAAMAAALFTASTGHTQVTWHGDSANGAPGDGVTWTDPLNWGGDVLPIATDDLIFGNGQTIAPINLAGPQTANSLTFNTPFTLGLALTPDILTITSGNISVGAGVSSRINAIVAGTSGLTLNGGGTLTLAGANTFTGPVAVNAGTTLRVSADNQLGAVANGVTLDTGILGIDGTFTSARVLTLGAGGGTVDVSGANNFTLSSALAVNANALTKSGNGTLTLGAFSTRTGTTAINSGRIAATNVSALGTGAVSVNGASSVYEITAATATSVHAINVSNGGTFQWLQNPAQIGTLTLGATSPLGFSGTGGTVFVGGAGSSGKVLANTGLITSTAGSTVNKTGGGVLQLAGANLGFLGDLSIQAGTVEFQNADALGAGTKTITVGSFGDLAVGNAVMRHNVTLNNDGILSANNAAANYTGAINVAGNGTVALRQFQNTAAATSFTISGPISGFGGLNVTAPAAATLTLSGDNSAFTGTLAAATNATVVMNTRLGDAAALAFTGGTIQLRAANLSSPVTGASGINATYYNFGGNPNASNNPPEFASLTLLEPTRVFSQIDQEINLPNSAGGGTHPVNPIPGFQFNINDGAMWKGLLNITNAGSYQFSALNDDNAVLFIDGVQVGIIGVSAGGANVGTPVTLSAGAHSIVWKFSQGTGGGYTQLRYNGGAGSDAPTTAVVGSVPGSLTTGSLAPTPVGSLNALSGTSTFDTGVNVAVGAFNGAGGATLNLTSGTMSDIVVTGPSTLVGTGTVTINPNTASITFNDGIAGLPGVGLTLNGSYLATFKGANTYSGLTTVSGGRLVLDSATGNSIAGNLTVNAANVLGRVRNVVLNQSNQISDLATVTVTSGILDIGANNETVGTLLVNGPAAEVIGSGGTLTAGTLDLRAGLVSANLAGTTGVNKNTLGTIALAGANTYTGLTTISSGVLSVRSNGALGAIGLGNGTSVSGAGQLQVQGSVNLAEEITLNGSSADGTGALRSRAGLNTLNGAITLASSAAIQVDSGELSIANPLSGGGTTLTVQGDGTLGVVGDPSLAGISVVKNGRGTLQYSTPLLAAFPAVTHNSGTLAFNGAQNFGPIAVPAGRAYQFNADPGAGTTVNVPAGTSLINGGAANNGLLSRVTGGSGSFVLTQDSGGNLDFTGKDVSLGARGLVTYSGTITPGAAGYSFSGLQAGLGDGIAPNRLTLTNALTGNNALAVSGGILDLTRLNNSQVGNIAIGAGGVVEVINNPNLGATANAISLDGGTLRVISTSGNAGALFGHLGNPLSGGSRVVNVGGAGGTIDVPSFTGGASGFSLGGNFSTNLAGDPLTGTGTLTKTGLGFLFLNNASDFAGNIVLAANSNQFDLRGNGSWVPATPTTLTIGSQATLNLDNANQLGSGRQVPGTYIGDRVGSNVGIVLQGGAITFAPRGAAGQSAESFGTITLGVGQNAINANSNPTGSIGTDLTVTNLVHQVGGTLRFGGTAGTYGATGANNTRVLLTGVNGAAPVAGHIGGWATIFGTNFVGYGANGVVIANGTDQGAASWTPAAGTVYNLNAAGTATLASAVAGAENVSMVALRFGFNGAQTLAFADAADTLYLGSGGIVTEGNNVARTIGGAVNQGKLTAGVVGATGLQELFLHNNASTTTTAITINSNIVNNSGTAPVAVVKDLDAQVTLAAANTYSGGTYVNRGILQANVAGSLGSGLVTVKNSRLNLQVAGTSTGTAGFRAIDDGEIQLAAATGNYTTGGDQFVIDSNAVIIGPNGANANQGLNSLTRVAGAPANGGEIQLAPGAIVGHQASVIGEAGLGQGTIKNLGTNADLFFGLSTNFSDPRTSLTVGAGTSWKGISTDRTNRAWEEGTILANSDFWLQGMTRDGGLSVLSLGATGPGTYSIVNQAGHAINAFIAGRVDLLEDSNVSLPSDLTFVLTAGSDFRPSFTGSLGSNANAALNAKIRILAGGTLNPAGFVGVGAAVNQPQGYPYPVPSPMNGFVTVEAGGRFVLDDASGAGSTAVGAWTIKTDGILELGNSGQVFLGSNSGLINDGQFVFESGAIVRFSADQRWFGLNEFVNNEPNGSKLTYQVYNGDRNLTEAVDPRIVAGLGVTTVVAQDLTIGAGGMLTNDSSDRTVRGRRGTINLQDGATLAGTTQSYLNIQEDLAIEAGATIQIGSTRWVDGQPKLGGVQLNGTASNTAGVDVTFNVIDGAQLAFAATHVFPDTATLHLDAAVTDFPAVGGTVPQPGNGSSLLLNTADYIEIIGALTGDGAVIANNNGGGTSTTGNNTGLGVGWGATSDFTFNGVFKGGPFTNRAPSLVKVGSTKLTLTNTSDAPGTGTASSPASITVYQGEVSLAGPNGRWVGGELRLARGGTLTFDNSVNAITDRQGTGTGNRWLTAMGGGDFRLLGHATQVADVAMFGLANSAGSGGLGVPGGNSGGFGTVTVLPAAGTTSLTTSVTFGAMERFDNTGERKSAWLIRGTGVGGLPGTYSSNGTYTPNAGNPVDGLVFLTNPNFIAGGTYGAVGNASGFIFGAPGTPVVPVRGDLLASSNPTATEGDFATIDIASGANRTGVRVLQASEYAATATSNATLALNVRATGALSFTGDTRFQVAKLEDGSSLNVSGLLPNLTQPSQIVLTAGGILVPSGATADLSASDNSVIRTASGVSAYIHAFGDLNVSGTFFSDQGLVKTGAGTATFAAGSLDGLRGRLSIHEGTVNLNDSLANIRATGLGGAVGFTGTSVALNSGTLNLNGKSQLFNTFESGNILSGAATEGGTLISEAPAQVTIQGGGAFSGHIDGAITLDKVGNNTLLLTNSNSTTGNVAIRQGTITLRDNGTLSNVGSVDINYGRLEIENGYLSAVDNRVNSAATINLRGGDIIHRGRAGAVTQQTFGTVNILQGNNLIQGFAGGAGAVVTTFDNFNRSAGATIAFQQNSGFVGTAGNDTSAIRYMLNNVSVNGGPVTTPAALMATNNGILGGWAIVNNDHFATYDSVRGIGALGNTEDGFAAYGSGDLSTATGTQNVNDGSARTIATSKAVNAIRNGPTADQAITLNAGVVLTINSGGLLTNANFAIAYNGGSITSNSGELNAFVQQNTTTINSVITGNIALTKAGSGTLSLTGNNNYTGITYVGQGSSGASSPSGTLSLGTVGADGTTVVAVPGDLEIHNSIVTVAVARSIHEASDVTLFGGATLNMRDAASVTETLRSLTFLNAGGDNTNRPIVSRANAQATSALNLTGATAISSTNDNPTSTPTLSTNLGRLNFTGPAGSPQAIEVHSPVTTNGLAAIGLISNTNIGSVPTGVAEGGLVKTGNGLLVLAGTDATQFGNPGATTEVFNIQSGYVRVDTTQGLGPVTAVTTVQDGATLLLNNNGTGITGSIRLKDGSRLGATLNASVLGAVGSTGFVDVPAGADVQVDAFDSLLPTTNVGNITINHLLTGSGTINQVGIEYAAGYNGGGILQLRNTGNTFSGIFNVGTNAILDANPNDADLSGNTFGTALINLNGGVLRVRDQANNLAGAQTITYGNNVNLNADSMIDVDRLGTVANQKTIAFGTLTVADGTQVLSTPYGTAASITPNDYRVAFAQVDGTGTLVKGGSRYVDLNGYAGTFSGNIEVAGPQGFNLPTSGNLTLNAATNNINNLTVRGFHNFAAGKAVAIANTLDVGNNAGQVVNGLNGVNTGSSVGVVTLNATSNVSANVIRNYGIIAANNSAATLNAPVVTGSGLYHAYGQNLTLTGALTNDGVNPSTLKVAGTSASTAVILTTTDSTSTGGAEVQSGVLRVAPTGGIAVNPLGSGAIRVYGAPATALGAGSQPVAAQNATLEFVGSNISQTSDITNTGTLRVVGGVTTINGIVRGTPNVGSNSADFLAATVPGLLEGRLTTTGALPDTDANGRLLTAARPANPGNFGVKLEPRMGQTSVVTQNGLTGWSDNTAWIYTGYFYDADGVFTFMENIDDGTLVSIDGINRLLNSGNRVTSTATQKGQSGNTLDTANVNTAAVGDLITAATPLANNPNLPAGWHTIEIRFDNGTGGAGPWITGANGFGANYGFGFNPNGTMALDGTQAFRPIDPGDGTLFRTAAAGRGNIEVGGAGNAVSVTLNVERISQVGTVILNGGSTNAATLNLTATGANDAQGIAVAGPTTPKGAVNVANGASLSVGTLSVAAGGTLTINENGFGDITVEGAHTLATASAVILEAGTLRFQGSGGDATASVEVHSDATLDVRGSLTGTVNISAGGLLEGIGVINGPVTVLGGIISPGNSPGSLDINGTVDFGANSQFLVEVGGAVPGDGLGFYSQLNMTNAAASVNLSSTATITLSLSLGYLPVPGDLLFVFTRADGAAFVNPFANALEGSTITLGPGIEGTITYMADWIGNQTGSALTGGNDIAVLVTIPEPGSATLLLGGLGSLLAMRRRRRTA